MFKILIVVMTETSLSTEVVEFNSKQAAIEAGLAAQKYTRDIEVKVLQLF